MMKRKILLNLINQIKDNILNSDGVEEEDYDAENLNVDSDGGDDEIIFDKELVDENLSRINLSIELQQHFNELYNVRRSVILHSHLSNKGLEGSPDDDEIDEDFLHNIDKNLPLSMDATIEEIDLLKYVLSASQPKGRKGKKKAEQKNLIIQCV
eukprot:CAMPEP_0170075090 /NCGR_PEP_ID=MMETSP0019_2-20121128/12283_1 /TAXON_ID=98059 /ORGANISM="Dinobryon sp., Strain UTEXLB2267" /LENGTH=153 /DNA_ID=CAMNT_0010285823 /DNA_START=164 /DNA_END=626 /DNA_ORIENTATION=-